MTSQVASPHRPHNPRWSGYSDASRNHMGKEVQGGHVTPDQRSCESSPSMVACAERRRATKVSRQTLEFIDGDDVASVLTSPYRRDSMVL